jgi:AcrR family transcriptional regulator
MGRSRISGRTGLTSKAKATRPRRKRRSTEEVLDSIVKAASAEFERNGYSGATTAAIARRAGVAEALIFTNFGSKANVFHKSIFDPLSEQLVQFYNKHLVDGKYVKTRDFDAQREQYIGALQAFVKDNAGKLTSLVVARLYPEGVQDVGNVDGLQQYFAQGAAFAEDNIRKPPAIDPHLVSRISFATILSCILFREWLFPEAIATDRQIDDAVIAQVIGGLRINDA